jgi:hypothetical protein
VAPGRPSLSYVVLLVHIRGFGGRHTEFVCKPALNQAGAGGIGAGVALIFAAAVLGLLTVAGLVTFGKKSRAPTTVWKDSEVRERDDASVSMAPSETGGALQKANPVSHVTDPAGNQLEGGEGCCLKR